MSVQDRDLRPRSFDEYIGQSSVKERLQVQIEAAVAKNRPLPHVLLIGTPGCGKTTLASIIADQLGDPMVTLMRPVDDDGLEQALWELGEGVLFIDEVQEWKKAQQARLLTLMEDGMLETKWGKVPYPWLTLIAATTDEQALTGAFIDRFMIVPHFQAYAHEEMATIVGGMAAKAGVELDGATIDGIAGAAAGMPRSARELVLAARDLADVGRQVTASEVLAFAQIDPDGLTCRHRDYLTVLADMGNRAGLKTLASRLRIHETAVVHLERLLLELHLIAQDPRGRRLTPAGRVRVGAGDEPGGRRLRRGA